MQTLLTKYSGSGDGYDATSDLLPPEQEHDKHLGIMPNSMLGSHECDVCEQRTSRRCAHCNLGWFCCQRCQDRMSFHHLTKCSARPITTADILLYDVVKNEIPKDDPTREAFGFNRCCSHNEQSHLLGLYIGLLLVPSGPQVSPVELDEWQREDLLAGKIIEKFSALPVHGRGSYFPWFLRNQHVLETSTPAPHLQNQYTQLQRALDAARPYLEPEDCEKELSMLEPIEKRYCFMFFAFALDSSYPNPNWVELDLWYDFGFALCTDEYHEGSLGALYSRLVGGRKFRTDYEKSLGIASNHVPSSPTCSFNEFWVAWKNGSMAQLFDKYGMGNDIDGFNGKMGVRHLREFMSFPVEKHELRPSVWRLKHLLALDYNKPLGGFPKIETAALQYGFTPQLDARTTMELRQFYQQMLKANDPLQLYRAKERAKLLDYAESSLNVIDGRVRDVLRNIDSTNAIAHGKGGIHSRS